MGGGDARTVGARAVGAVLAVAGIALVVFVFLGPQASGVLSTVGASVGPRGDGSADDGQRADGAVPQEQPDRPPAGSGASVYSIDRPDLLIIKTGSIAIQVRSLDLGIDGATEAITGLGGYASGSERSGDGDDASASIIFRVPVDRWDDALEAIGGLAEKILRAESASEEVTGEVADLGARIRNLEATERALQAIMDRATVIKDVLTVQSELTEVRDEIERLATQKSQLEAQAAMSTLTVSFSLRGDPVLVVQAGYDPAAEVDAATASLVDILQAVLTAGIWLAIVWAPVVGTLGILALIGYAIARRFRRSGVEVALRP